MTESATFAWKSVHNLWAFYDKNRSKKHICVALCVANKESLRGRGGKENICD